MSFRCFLQRILSVLVCLSVTSLVYLYLYPAFHGCAFPLENSPPTASSNAIPHFSNAFLTTLKERLGFPPDQNPPAAHAAAPFRLLVLADPQIEGDSSLPQPQNQLLPRLVKHWKAVRLAETGDDRLNAAKKGVRDILVVDIPRTLRAVRKRIDLRGNDLYLAHIYRTLKWWSRPTHVTVLGDLIGSQWVSDGEFEARAWRYWNRVFRGGVRVDDEVTRTGSEDMSVAADWDEDEDADGDVSEVVLDLDSDDWSNRIINVAGNHDVGYAGDISEERMTRFGREFGRANWDVRFKLPLSTSEDGDHGHGHDSIVPTLHLINLNSLLLDTPAFNPDLQAKTYKYINDLVAHRSHPVEDRTTFTLLLTHLPLHKPDGVCTDGPYFDFHQEDDENSSDGEPRFKAGGLREQNHISEFYSHNGILQGLFGMTGNTQAPAQGVGRNGLILTGHDHTGCDVIHYVDRESGDNGESWSWSSRAYHPKLRSDSSVPSNESQPTPSPSIREVTLRSMMGEYGGNAGLLSVWFDPDPNVREWKYEIAICKFGVQHIWWAVHITAVVTLLLVLFWIVLTVVEGRRGQPGRKNPVSTKPKDSRNQPMAPVKETNSTPTIQVERSSLGVSKGKAG